MGWPASLGVGILTAAITTVLAGFVANLSVGWYRISSFEGQSGYFVVFMALLGLVGGFLIGVVVSRIVAAGADPGFLRAFGLAQAAAIATVLLIGGASRLLADLPPRLDGDDLLLAIELRWPEGRSPAEVADSTEPWLRLSASSGGALRDSREGPLWREDARLDDEGRWVVPGAVDLFTSRGNRIIAVEPAGIVEHGAFVPLGGRPNRKQLEWSAWLPLTPSADASSSDSFQYRFRIVPVSQPIRSERFGPFEIVTFASGFQRARYEDRPAVIIAGARFALRHQGHPVVIEHASSTDAAATRFERLDAVAALPGSRPALLVQIDARNRVGPCYLVAEDGNQLRIEHVALCYNGFALAPLTSDAEVFARARSHPSPEGRFDRASFVEGLYLMRDVVFDTRTLTWQPHTVRGRGQMIERIPPLGVAPDEKHFIRVAWSGAGNEEIELVVIPLGDGEPYTVPVDRTRMRFTDIDQIDPAWVLHHFVWEHRPGSADRLVERPGFRPLPYRGTFTRDGSDYREYRLSPALEGLRTALIEFLVSELRAEPIAGEANAFAQRVRLGEAVVHVGYDAGAQRIMVWMDRGTDSQLVATIAERFDTALATGRYDPLFAR